MLPPTEDHSAPPPASIRQVEFLSDRLRVHFHCPRPWGVADENGVQEVLFAAIPALPCLPEDLAHGEFREAWEEAVPVPTLGTTLVFRFARWQETDDCRMTALIGGPYRMVPAPGSFA
jgi:hypothetical protein